MITNVAREPSLHRVARGVGPSWDSVTCLILNDLSHKYLRMRTNVNEGLRRVLKLVLCQASSSGNVVRTPSSSGNVVRTPSGPTWNPRAHKVRSMFRGSDEILR